MALSQYNHIDDAELLDKFYADRNNEWLGILLQRYTLLLLGVCMKYLKNEEEAKDSVQQIFEKVISELQKYPVTYFKSWLYMIAKNHCLMKMRNKGRFVAEWDESIVAPLDEDIDKNSFLQKDQDMDDVLTALQRLNKEQKQCVTLFYLQKKSYLEIVSITGYSLLQVKSHLQNGKRNLKNLILRKNGKME